MNRASRFGAGPFASRGAAGRRDASIKAPRKRFGTPRVVSADEFERQPAGPDFNSSALALDGRRLGDQPIRPPGAPVGSRREFERRRMAAVERIDVAADM